MVATSIAPVLFTYWFIEQVNNWNNSISLLENIKCNWIIGIGYLIAKIAFVVIFLIIVKLAKSIL
jgi:hypothetical protein